MNLKRIGTLVEKELKQMSRESSNIGIGIILPIILLLIFGYGMSMDVRNIRLAIVKQEDSEIATRVIAHFRNSKYFTVTVFSGTADGVREIKENRADGCLFLPPNLPQNLQSGKVKIQICMNAANASVARMYENYIRQVAASVFNSTGKQTFHGVISLKRMWFNNTNESCYYMIPGVIVIILSLIGCMLTSLQMAKEYEHGNMESMFVTPMTAGEILLAKMANNYLLGMIGLTVALLFSRYLFQVPIRGSIWLVLLGSSVFLMLQMALGLLISSITKNQFLACQIALVVAFLPVVLLSGFLYEIPNMPVFLQYFTCLVPARYYVDFLQTIFLVGNVPSNIIKNLCIMGVFSLVLLFLAKLTNPKRLGGG